MFVESWASRFHLARPRKWLWTDAAIQQSTCRVQCEHVPLVGIRPQLVARPSVQKPPQRSGSPLSPKALVLAGPPPGDSQVKSQQACLQKPENPLRIECAPWFWPGFPPGDSQMNSEQDCPRKPENPQRTEVSETMTVIDDAMLKKKQKDTPEVRKAIASPGEFRYSGIEQCVRKPGTYKFQDQLISGLAGSTRMVIPLRSGGEVASTGARGRSARRSARDYADDGGAHTHTQTPRGHRVAAMSPGLSLRSESTHRPARGLGSEFGGGFIFSNITVGETDGTWPTGSLTPKGEATLTRRLARYNEGTTRRTVS
ncbi:hypothetical protein B0H13DRAFT_1912463 [Mycena leptocephala]|nr:hypothetical protein B0H13DRAFT_1912463 [Mycena leptocephala]